MTTFGAGEGIRTLKNKFLRLACMPVPTLPQNKELIFLSIDNAMKKDLHKKLRPYRGNCMTLIASKSSHMGFAPKFFDIVDVLSNRPQEHGTGGRSRTYEDLRLRSYSPRPLASWVPLHSVMKINGQGVRNADFFGDSVLNIF